MVGRSLFFLAVAFGTLSVRLAVAQTQAVAGNSEFDRVLAAENRALGVELPAQPVVTDAVFLRRAMVDLAGRIPTEAEIREYAAWPRGERRARLVEKLLAHERFADRWTVFFADMLRLRSERPGGGPLVEFVRQAVAEGMPYDELCRRLISANGRPSTRPEAAFVLGDNADPLALAAVTAQVFLGVRIGCAQCHDHPFDVWTRRDFYGMAAYFGRTRLVANEFAKMYYTTEGAENVVQWPPEGEPAPAGRKPQPPTFPISLLSAEATTASLARHEALRAARERLAAQRLAAERAAAAKKAQAGVVDEVEDLLSNDKIAEAEARAGAKEVVAEMQRDMQQIDLDAARYAPSELRNELADMITSPRSPYFARALVNRVWKDLMGRGFVEPIDDFREGNPPSHPQTLDFLAQKFIDADYDLRSLIRLIVLSDAYQRVHASQADAKTRGKLEAAFLATPPRRMLSEALYDSIVTAGHLEAAKYPPGANMKRIRERRLVASKAPAEDDEASPLAQLAGEGGKAAGMSGMAGGAMQRPALIGYDLESSIDAGALRKEEDALEIAKMEIQSEAEIMREAEVRAGKRMKPRMVETFVETIVDHNPIFGSSMQMITPAPEGHFLRIFGQPARDQLGDLRESDPSMRQALMMLNGSLTHEAARVGPLEPVFALLNGKHQNWDEAIRLVYREILTRQPAADELAEGRAILETAPQPEAGMADLRWVLLNSHDFRFLP